MPRSSTRPEKTKKTRIRWRKYKSDVWGSRPQYELVGRDGEVTAHAAQLENGRWYWYGHGMNTAHASAPSLEAAKDQCVTALRNRGVL